MCNEPSFYEHSIKKEYKEVEQLLQKLTMQMA